MEKKKRFKMPHAYVIIFMMTVITAILANIIPAGTFDRVAGVKMFSGLGYRILCFVVFMGISIWYVWRYARRIQKDPTKSYLYGEKIEMLECASREEMSVWCTSCWYRAEASLLSWKMHRSLIPVVYWLATMLQHFRGMASAMGMLFAQNIINFFIPSGAGQALITMPILAPVGEMVGVSRQVSVLAYQFGDGFSNIFWPTSVFMMCGIMRLPINKWYRFVTPLFLIIFAASIVLLGAAVVIGY